MNENFINKQNLKIKAIKCPQCGGSIELKGGHKVKSIVCQYCATCLDTKDNFKILYKFVNRKKPFSPLKLGQKGKLKGINFTVIGLIQYEQQSDGEVYRWLEYLLYSFTHGYAWLIHEDGHWCLSHEVKDIPLEGTDIWQPLKTPLTVRDKTFKVFECSSVKIIYVEGELTWLAKANERTRYLDAICPPCIYTIEKRANELEFFWGEYITPSEIEDAFKIKTYPPVGVYSCQPYETNPITKAAARILPIFALISLILYLFISTQGKCILTQNLRKKPFKDTVITKTFKVDKDNTLMGIEVITSGLSNEWAYYTIQATDKQEKYKFFTLGVETGYYFGSDSDGRWVENNKDKTAYFKLPAGEYKLIIEAEGGYGNNETSSRGFEKNTVIKLYVHPRMGHFLLIWGILCLLFTIFYFINYLAFERRRWGEDEEDDD